MRQCPALSILTVISSTDKSDIFFFFYAIHSDLLPVMMDRFLAGTGEQDGCETSKLAKIVFLAWATITALRPLTKLLLQMLASVEVQVWTRSKQQDKVLKHILLITSPMFLCWRKQRRLAWFPLAADMSSCSQQIMKCMWKKYIYIFLINDLNHGCPTKVCLISGSHCTIMAVSDERQSWEKSAIVAQKPVVIIDLTMRLEQRWTLVHGTVCDQRQATI